MMKTYTRILVLFLCVLVGAFSAVAGTDRDHEDTSPLINESLLLLYKHAQQACSLFEDQLSAYENMVILADETIDIQTDADALQRLLHATLTVPGIPEPHQETLRLLIHAHAEYSGLAQDMYGELAKNFDSLTTKEEKEFDEKGSRLVVMALTLQERLETLSETLYAELEGEIENANTFIKDALKRSQK